MGRPSTYSEDVAAEICERLSKGEPLAQICRDEGMPAVSTVWAWERAHDGLSEAIARARLEGYDAIAAEALRIADTPVEGVETKETADGVEIKRADMLGHRKLQVETRLKLLAKWDPKRYGDRLDLGNADGQPFQIVNKRFGRGGENG